MASRRRVRLAPEHFEAAFRATLEAYPPGNPAGVFGAAIQRKRVRGRKQGSWTVAVFVPRKDLEPTAPVQAVRFLHDARWLEFTPDVVATGREAAGAAGGAAHFTGLHAGAAIRIATGLECTGGVACLLSDGERPTHLLTAGHLFPPAAPDAPVLAARSPLDAAEVVGRLERNLLEGAGAAIDAAVVRLTPEGIRMAETSGTALRLPRLLPDPFPSALVDSTWLRVFLSMAGDYQTDLEGTLKMNRFSVQSGCRAPHVISDVVTTGFAQNVEGNSGTVLMSDDRSGGVAGQAVGIAVGFAGNLSLHEPMDRALARGTAATGRQFRIWSQP